MKGAIFDENIYKPGLFDTPPPQILLYVPMNNEKLFICQISQRWYQKAIATQGPFAGTLKFRAVANKMKPARKPWVAKQ